MDQYVLEYNNSEFIENDPISIPHLFSKKQDIEIIGFWVAMLAWGQRKTIINKSKELLELMDQSPYDFVCNHEPSDLKSFVNFKHRTFNYDDTLYFLHFFKKHYKKYKTLEDAFGKKEWSVKERLIHFHEYFFDNEVAPNRTKKHVSTPSRSSACKRLNMFLRWMVRKDKQGVDFGIWNTFKMADLMIPLDVHVFKVASQLDILKRKKADWLAVEELTEFLKILDPNDPVKYDYALFSLGVLNKS